MPRQKLSSREQQEFAERLMELARSGMSLPAGLQAAAAETKSRRLAGQLKRLSTQIESGENWSDALLKGEASGLPPHLLGVIRAGICSGNLAEALDGLVDQQRARSDIWRRLRWSLAYPVTLLICVVILFLFTLVFVVRPMERLFVDFGAELPTLTEFWVELSHTLPRTMFWITLGAVVICLLIRLIGGRIGWIRFVSSLPILGPIVHWSGVAEMMHLLRIMLVQEMQLPEALRLTSSGIADANMAVVSRWLADGIEAGIPLADLMDATPRIPAWVVPIVRWGEHEGSLAQAVQSAQELLEGRIRMRTSLLSLLLSPLIFIFVSAGIVLLVMGLFLPMTSLLRNLI